MKDPLQQTQYICMPTPRVCELQLFQSIPVVAVPRHNNAADSARGIVWEDLGSQTIEGFEVHGTRETTIFAPGTVGNDQPTTSVREYWYSPQLGINLLTIRKDPATGTQTFRLTDIRLDEPDHSLFFPPADYRIIDTRKEVLLQQGPQ